MTLNSHPHRLIVFSLIALLVLAACTRPAATSAVSTSTEAAPTAAPETEAATQAAAPTDTEAAPATDTAVPVTETSSPVPATNTPPVPATPDPNEGVGDVVFQDPLDGTTGWNWSFTDPNVTLGIVGGQLQMASHSATGGWYWSSSPDTVRVGNQQVRAIGRTATCAENDEYGMVFRVRSDAQGNYEMYLFKLRCGGAARFEYVRNGVSTTIVDWTPSAAIKAGAPAENALLAWMRGSEFRFYANDQYLFSANDATLADGYYGFYLWDRTNGNLVVNFDELVARSVGP